MRLALVLAGLFFVGCGVQKSVDRTNSNSEKLVVSSDKIEKSSAKISDATHVQILSISLDGMLKVTDLAFPVRMFPYAQSFTAEATPKEIIETSYMLLQHAKKSPVIQFKDRLVSVNALSALAGFTSAEKTQVILDEQRGDFLEDATYEWLTARYAFIKQALLQPLMAGSCVSKKCADRAKFYFSQMVAITAASHPEKLKLDIDELLVHLSIDNKEDLAALKEYLLKKYPTLSNLETSRYFILTRQKKLLTIWQH
jgi:hypothetical protein